MCAPGQPLPPDGACPTGQQTIAALGLDEWSIGANAAALVVYIVVCRVAAFLGCRYIKW